MHSFLCPYFSKVNERGVYYFNLRVQRLHDCWFQHSLSHIRQCLYNYFTRIWSTLRYPHIYRLRSVAVVYMSDSTANLMSHARLEMWSSSLAMGCIPSPFLFAHFYNSDDCHLLDYVSYVPYNDTIINQSVLGIYFTPCQNIYTFESKH